MVDQLFDDIVPSCLNICTVNAGNTTAIVLVFGGVEQKPENITAVSVPVEDCMGLAEIFFRFLMAPKYSDTRARITDLITIRARD